MFYAFGYNQYNISNSASEKNNDCIHAEIDCINHLKKSIKCEPLNLCVFRTNKTGSNLLMAKPCNKCLKLIDITLKKKNYILKNIYYSDESSNLVKLIK